MRRSVLAILGATALTAISTFALAQAPAAPGTAPAAGKSGVNVGSLQCKVAGGMGFVFGSSKDLDCILARTDGVAEHYTGSINRYGVDIGFTKEAHIVWLVFAPGAIGAGALAGDYGGVTAGASFGVGLGANVLVGGSNKQIALQPVSVEGSVGLNVAAGVASVTLKPAK
ncbi:MAG: DUF992 domain-containing protein [Enhydrobacter sp.]|nr:DUF992 domain-containing protein [Enhydrobacter sp.]